MRLRLLVVVMCLGSVLHAADAKPNFIIILCDNLGYGDVGCYGSKTHRTPNIDRFANEGIRFTSAYAVSGVCTPSRAGLMTGCYPIRVGLHQNARGGPVLQPVEPIGLHPDETTMAEVLKTQGYATALVGKWHLGDQPEFLPTRQGFDSYLGIPYSDDMVARPDYPHWPPLPLVQGETVIEAPVDRNPLTARYTQEIVDLIARHRERPFFLVLSHAMPGSTQASFASERFRGKSGNGLWGDAIEEIDWSTGEIVKALKTHGLDEKTLVVWTNDNGAPRRTPTQGSNEPLSGWGYSTAEGGMRVPLMVRWPGRVPAERTSDEVIALIDLLPTFAKLSGAKLPERTIDGRDLRAIFLGEAGAKSPHEAIYFYHRDQLQAIRAGAWKLYFPQAAQGKQPALPARLFDVATDIRESRNCLAQQRDVVKRLEALAESARDELGDGPSKGKGVRAAGRVVKPVAMVKP